ncbi:MAG: hypothetical protein AAFO09_08395 [Pseudomonadota bacterium]
MLQPQGLADAPFAEQADHQRFGAMLIGEGPAQPGTQDVNLLACVEVEGRAGIWRHRQW